MSSKNDDPGRRLCGHDNRIHYLGGGLRVCFACWLRAVLGVAVLFMAACSVERRLFVEQRCAEPAPVPEQLECFKNCVDNNGSEEAEDQVFACQGVCERMLCPKETVVFEQGFPEDAIPCTRAKERAREACVRHGARP